MSKNDERELLEMAAKAAGINHPGGEHSIANDGRLWDCNALRWWNPLTDDGDALRLEVKLDMSVKQDDPNAVIAGWSNLQRINITHSKPGPWYWKEWLRDHGNDRTAATRRAIVRAAAEIGKAMP